MTLRLTRFFGLLRQCRSIAITSARCWRWEGEQGDLFNVPRPTDARWTRVAYRDLWNRKQFAGPDAIIARSRLENWNRNSELYALAHRLGASLVPINDSQKLDRELSLCLDQALNYDGDGETHVNALAEAGEGYTRGLVVAYLRRSLPEFPEVCLEFKSFGDAVSMQEGVQRVADYLLSAGTLAYIGRHLLIHDLIVKTEPLPLRDELVRKSVLAVVQVLRVEATKDKAGSRFVKDFILPQLLGIDVACLCHVHEPLRVLRAVLRSRSRDAIAEPRLQHRSGTNSYIQTYVVGIYDENKNEIGQGAGELLHIAVDMAARDALCGLWGVGRDDQDPFDYQSDLIEDVVEPNNSLAAICRQHGDFELSFEQQPIFSSSRDYSDEERDALEREYDDPVFNDLPTLYEQWKSTEAKALSGTYRRRERHRYSRGTRARRNMRAWHKYTPHTI